jgi:hypothetical protein
MFTVGLLCVAFESTLDRQDERFVTRNRRFI